MLWMLIVICALVMMLIPERSFLDGIHSRTVVDLRTATAGLAGWIARVSEEAFIGFEIS